MELATEVGASNRKEIAAVGWAKGGRETVRNERKRGALITFNGFGREEKTRQRRIELDKKEKMGGTKNLNDEAQKEREKSRT